MATKNLESRVAWFLRWIKDLTPAEKAELVSKIMQKLPDHEVAEVLYRQYRS